MNTAVLILIAIFIIVHYVIKFLEKDTSTSIKPRDKYSRFSISEEEFYHSDYVFITPEDKKDYLQSKEWDTLRKQVLALYNYKCGDCDKLKSLEVHHITYKNWRHENLEDLIPLCRECHQTRHDKTGYSHQDRH